MNELPVAAVVNGGGLLLGLAFGALVQRTNFCTMGAISDLVLMGDASRLRAWLLAAGIAILGSQGLHMSGQVDLGAAIYATPNLGWLGALLGGAAFGFGMVQAGGCGSRSLVRLGAGNLKSLVALLVLGITAYATLRGLFGPVRQWLEGISAIDLKAFGISSQALPVLLAKAGLPAEPARAALALLLGTGLAGYALADAGFRAKPRLVLSGIGVGLIVVAGWAITGILGRDDFDPTPLASVTFVAPIGDSLVYLMTFTGAALTFGISSVGGMILGAFITAKLDGSFRIESFTSRDDLIGHLRGGALMGIGGVFALGCSIGQGLTGLSTLALSSFLAIAGIAFGAVLALRTLEEGSIAAACRVMFGAR
ncbi:YeeE/YedE family protein [Ferrovibrio sp.]|uniref:YeeE/YedE family protein n=1 Tax=Ferrovibrio sp. TaxID=1917215 RepID=UPI001B68D657|nr:YeeE/YedE family protein [Ferrovibrio sp.]MBP7065359.1 YeeE/YedE family protein [Ferrovibrio sp.]